MTSEASRVGRTRGGLALALGGLVLGGSTAVELASADLARADELPAGAITGQLVVSDGDLGGAGMLDLWAPIGPLRLGGFFGIGATPSARDWHNRTYMPLGVLVGLTADLGGTYLSVIARGGAWGGATQEAKLTIGGLVGGGAYLDFGIGEGIALGLGVEAWGLFGAGDTWAVLPGLRMTWGEPMPEPTPAPAPAPEPVGAP